MGDKELKIIAAAFVAFSLLAAGVMFFLLLGDSPAAPAVTSEIRSTAQEKTGIQSGGKAADDTSELASSQEPERKLTAVDFEEYKSAPKPSVELASWSESSLQGWSTLTMEFPDDDHCAEQFASTFASRKCELTAALRDDVEQLIDKWLHDSVGDDDLIIKKHGLEFAVGGYREDGLIRMKLAFTLAR